MAFIWTQEKVSELSLAEIKQLLSNAENRGNEEVCSICRDELEARKPKRSIPPGLPSDFVRATRTAVSKRLELDVVEMLVTTANRLLGKYDVSTEKARSLSLDSKRFIPHALLDRKGSAKVGGAQKQGRVVFDRYISYRLRDEVYALLGILLDGEDQTGVRYQVMGPERLLENYRPLRELRPYLMDGEPIGISPGGEEFSTYKEAEARFEWLIAQVAPKL
jgi:hypothetical protein